MKLTVVGCSGSFPGPDSPASCYLLEHEGFSLLLDVGNGAIGPLAKYISIDRIDAVALSHLHLDHCADLGALYVSRRYNPQGFTGGIPVLGPNGLDSRVKNLCTAERECEEPLDSVFDFREYSTEPVDLGPFQLEAHRVLHSVPAFALRVTAGGKTLVYSGDTAPCQQLVDASRGADVALFEASYLERDDNPPNVHLTGADAAKAATEAGVNRLILTHLVPWNSNDDVVADASRHFSGDLMVAHAGLTLTV